ncbi:hypothetical protein DLAC_00875 [Tieghemostelium lacteum]|uniref:tRNA pseudouridine(55) synthase n=1 Tax=Tieghemostelium lacteum TaxID=361077 RepID=A0A152A7H0_TIELA|nr:hypothetical protein DLAC_00875 [Tieghemostelium lacteum]|eukprot:KYR02075.1 hypothetical protein DLAC_00875 [Tieghemostelium lacteum]
MNDIGLRNLVWRLESIESRHFKNAHLQTVTVLDTIKVCPRCIFRFLNIKELGIYQESSSFLTHFIQFILFNEHKRIRLSSIDKKIQTASKPEEPKDSDTPSSTSTTTETTDIEMKNNENSSSSNNIDIDIQALNEEKEKIKELKFQCGDEQIKEFVCVACVGMLQNTNDKEFLDVFLEKMGKTGFEFVDYSLALTVPTSTTIREYAIWYYLNSLFPEMYVSKDPNIVELKEGIKWILGPAIQRSLKYRFKPNSDFRGKMEYIHIASNKDHKFLKQISQQSNKRQRFARGKTGKVDSNNSVIELINQVSKEDFIKFGQLPPKEPTGEAYKYNLEFHHENIYIAGRYNKISRDVTQTPWKVDLPSQLASVSTTVCEDLKDLFQCDSHTFSASGREDVDVRMLGSGRPFFIEICNPRKIFIKYQQFREYEEKVNLSGKVILSNLQMITKKETNIIKESEPTKKKDYRCVVWTSKAMKPSDLDELKKLSNIKVSQLTPVRVLHRRTLMTRDKVVEKLDYKFISPHFFVLDVLGASAGTYIKEFVHGDLGRTLPNVGTLLGCDADILQLDVLNVDAVFPGKPSETPKK